MFEDSRHHLEIRPATEESSSGRRTNLIQPVSPNRQSQEVHRAVLKGDWEKAKRIYALYPEEISYDSIITIRNETVLHIVVTLPTENLKFVEEVVEKMSDEALETRDIAGNTAFFVASIAGKIEFAKVMMKRKEDLAMIRGGEGDLPLYVAASRAYSEMARWLYKETETKYTIRVLNHEDMTKIFVALISSNIYDVALDMIQANYWTFGTARGPRWESGLFALAKKRSLTWDLSNVQDFPAFEEEFSGIITWKNFIYRYPFMLCIMKPAWNNFFRYAPLRLVNFILEDLKLSHKSKILDVIDWNTISIAVQNGNAELLSELIDSFPDLFSLRSDDGNGYTIFHLAALHRQEDIFRLIHRFYSITEKITLGTDKEGNNMLHLAAKLQKTSKRLVAVSGPALKMQVELRWYKEVEKVVPSMFSSEMNEQGKTPEDEFIESHMDLLKESDKLMRGIADKCMLVATLVATVVFTAAFQLPGDVKDNGNPNFLHKTAFKFFFMADAVSLVSSVASVMIFLGLMTSKYQIHDFHVSVPRKLIIGLALLFISLASMLVAFVATTFLVFKHGNKDEQDQHHGIGLMWFAIPIAVIGAGPIILFIWTHLRLFMDAWIQIVNPKSISLQEKWAIWWKAFHRIKFANGWKQKVDIHQSES